MCLRNLSGAVVLVLTVIAMAPTALAAEQPANVVSPAVTPMADWTKPAGFWVSLGGTVLTLVAFWFGLAQYRNAQKWKRVEFVAQEMKAFFENSDVNNALMMIDWASRPVDLHRVGPDHRKDWPVVTYDSQTAALRLHTLMPGGIDAESTLEGFDQTETRIRDTYDRLLDAWERFGAYLRSNLIKREDIEPYLEYWITDVARATTDPVQALWNCGLFAYIEFYGFKNVQFLLSEFGHDISTNGELYAAFAEVGDVKPVAERMRQECLRHW